MPDFSWIQTEDRLSPAALTVQAQAVTPVNDTGQPLLWDAFFPRQDVDSVDLRELTPADYRPAADRREWNARGRLIPILTPSQRDMRIVPIEAYSAIGEYEMQRLGQRADGNVQRLRELVGAAIPERVDSLAQADYRRLEMDAFSAWANGNIPQRDPQDASKVYTVPFGFAAERMTVAPVAWNDGGANAYDLFLAWYSASVELCGPGEGVVLRQATLNAILADAPTITAGSLRMSRPQIEADVQDRTGGPFRFIVLEQSMDVFNDGGTTTSRTKIWPAQKVAFVPAGGNVGVTAFAPVLRAMDMAAAVPGAKIDRNGVTIFYEPGNGHRELVIEAQLNAIPVPDERRVSVINAGV